MFVDKVKVKVHAGDGGDGVVSWRHEKYIDRGGPDGGDGGKGGDVVATASRNQNTLSTYRYNKLIHAKSGSPGSKRNRHGKNGEDLYIQVPVGTVMYYANGTILADLTEDGQEVIIAKGGKGGYGNAHFISSTRQAPRIAEKGEEGENMELLFELKMIADVGLVGLPNAGKSTFLASVSNAKPEIANYPFTTLVPNLGVVDIDNVSMLIADIPGLIEGASKGKGLGDEFLRHIERTAVILHLIDAYQDDVVGTYETIQGELSSYIVDLSKKPQIVMLTKIEGLDNEIIEDKIAQIKKVAPKKTPIMPVSSHSKEGVSELLRVVSTVVTKERAKKISKDLEITIPVLRLEDDSQKWTIAKSGSKFMVTGKKIERFAARTDFENDAGVERLRDIMKKMGILHELVRKGIEPGDEIAIGTKGTIEY